MKPHPVLAPLSLLALFAGPLAPKVASAADSAHVLLLEENFDYGDGPLAERPDSFWRQHKGSVIAQVSGGAVYLGTGDRAAGHVSRPFQTKAAVDPNHVRALDYRLQLKFEWLPQDSGLRQYGVIAQFVSHDASLRRARLHFRTIGPGVFRFGVTSRGGERPAWVEKPFAFGRTYEVLVRYDMTDGASRLWILEPGAEPEGAGDAVSTDPEIITPRRMSLEVDESQGPVIARVEALQVYAVP